MFDADHPIIKSSEDRLNRTTFAKYLARSLLDQIDAESFVVGLHGGYGVGKTSLLNLIIEELNFAASNMYDDEKAIILNFNPWNYSGQDQLLYQFFRRLSSTLRTNAASLEQAADIVELLELYISYFTQKPVPAALRRKKWWQKLTNKPSETSYAWESGKDLTTIKLALNNLLGEQKHRIIIIIDNISRLYDEEIKLVFQLIKSMGNFSNTTYLLSYDKDQVVHALDHIDIDGEAFIEKVVQLAFEVPPILQQDLETIFADRINAVADIVPEDAWDKEYWADVYYQSLRYFFENCRDITRYINTLSFGYPRIRDVVNPVDYFALTAIEVFTPDVYFGIRDNKDLFTDLLDDVYHLDEKKLKKDKLRCDEILGRNQRIPNEILLELLLRLFPRLRGIYRPGEIFYHAESRARKQKRICSPDLFDVYFRLSIHSARFHESELKTMLELASDAESFDQALARLNQDDRVLAFLDQLDGRHLLNIKKEHASAIINAFIDNGDLFPQGNSDLLSLDTPMRIHRIIHYLLQRFPHSDERFEILQRSIVNATKSIYIIVYELNEQLREHTEEEETYLPLEYRDITPTQLESLRKLTVTRIKAWASTGRLAEHPKLIPILNAWLDWGDKEECRQFVAKIVETDRGIVALLIDALDQPITEAMEVYHKNPAWRAYLNRIEQFISLDKLEQHAKALFEDGYFEKLREREQLALMIFLDLMKVKTTKIIPQTTAD